MLSICPGVVYDTAPSLNDFPQQAHLDIEYDPRTRESLPQAWDALGLIKNAVPRILTSETVCRTLHINPVSPARASNSLACMQYLTW